MSTPENAYSYLKYEIKYFVSIIIFMKRSLIYQFRKYKEKTYDLLSFSVQRITKNKTCQRRHRKQA